MNWYLMTIKQYVDFSGRARRKQYWFFTLINIILSLLLSSLDGLIGLFNVDAGLGLISGLYSLAILLPAIGVTVRRLHDTGRTGWWLLIGLIPLIGALVLLYFLVSNGEEQTNRFGTNPKMDDFM
ncbi:MAG: DUF805 domain-containing protein [Aliivibrio sp.]|uniref:DUF805 domain-containing protein n=1 Tax=Aliivibrio sp. TaxID=1872443 RepID=UPI001A553865|nr:DUF805 domain-containing protein [Aliivibrio sp.]